MDIHDFNIRSTSDTSPRLYYARGERCSVTFTWTESLDTTSLTSAG